jgi:hypothetical protein
MDLEKYYFALKNCLFTDLNLTIINNSKNQIDVDLHKIILYSWCPYFQKLLTSCIEALSNEILIKVPDANVIYDLIMSCYGQKTNRGNLPDWEHTIKRYICSDFLELQVDYKINNLKVPPEEFELLLTICDSMPFPNNDIYTLVRNNIPENLI